MAVTEDLVDGHRYQRVLAGFTIVRVFRVDDLQDTPERQLIEAANDPGIPDIGDTYPGTTGILAREINSTPMGPNAARVEVVYSARANTTTYNQPLPAGNDGQDVKQISAGVREVVTPRDRANNPMTLSANGTDYEGWPDYQSEARLFIPAGEIVFERVETSPAVDRARGFVARLNSLSIGNYAAETLLFVNLDAQSDDGGRRWNCVYTFRYSFDGWKHTDRFHGPDGKVPIDATEASWDVLPIADFSLLGLDFGDGQTPIT